MNRAFKAATSCSGWGEPITYNEGAESERAASAAGAFW